MSRSEWMILVDDQSVAMLIVTSSIALQHQGQGDYQDDHDGFCSSYASTTGWGIAWIRCAREQSRSPNVLIRYCSTAKSIGCSRLRSVCEKEESLEVSTTSFLVSRTSYQPGRS